MKQENKQPEGHEPAFPFIDTGNPNGPIGLQKGLSSRDYACIHLKTPATGKPWLDELIREAKRDEFIKEALNGSISPDGAYAANQLRARIKEAYAMAGILYPHPQTNAWNNHERKTQKRN